FSSAISSYTTLLLSPLRVIRPSATLLRLCLLGLCLLWRLLALWRIAPTATALLRLGLLWSRSPTTRIPLWSRVPAFVAVIEVAGGHRPADHVEPGDFHLSLRLLHAVHFLDVRADLATDGHLA